MQRSGSIQWWSYQINKIMCSQFWECFVSLRFHMLPFHRVLQSKCKHIKWSTNQFLRAHTNNKLLKYFLYLLLLKLIKMWHLVIFKEKCVQSTCLEFITKYKYIETACSNIFFLLTRIYVSYLFLDNNYPNI